MIIATVKTMNKSHFTLLQPVLTRVTTRLTKKNLEISTTNKECIQILRSNGRAPSHSDS